VKVSNTYTYAS